MTFIKRASRLLAVIVITIAPLKFLQVPTGLDLVLDHNSVGRAIPFNVVSLSLAIAIVCVWLMFGGVGHLRHRARNKLGVS